MEATVLISVANAELRCQLRGFLHEEGLHLLEEPTEGKLAGTAQRVDLDLVLADTCVHHSPKIAEQMLADRPDLKLLLISSEPEYVGRSLIRDPRVVFIETPFAWRELRARIARMISPAARSIAAGF